MTDELQRQQAMILFDRAHRHQMKGELGDAIALYRRSLAIVPTAEAFTFLGWAYSMLNRLDEAIECCRQAIAVDPDFGNPYNDIGAYLIELKRWDEAKDWLEKALQAPRYESPHFAHLNLGRVHENRGRFLTALTHYERALEMDPFYREAAWAKYQLLGSLN